MSKGKSPFNWLDTISYAWRYLKEKAQLEVVQKLQLQFYGTNFESLQNFPFRKGGCANSMKTPST